MGSSADVAVIVDKPLKHVRGTVHLRHLRRLRQQARSGILGVSGNRPGPRIEPRHVQPLYLSLRRLKRNALFRVPEPLYLSHSLSYCVFPNANAHPS